MTGEAKFSACGRFRWWLTRVWDPALPMAALIGMNPSTANAIDNDPTVTREINHVKGWGFGGLLKLNAYAYRATLPAMMWAAKKRGIDIVGAENTTEHILDYLNEFKVKKIVACWGRMKGDRGWLLAENLKAMGGVQLDCFKKNADGSPAHPLYLPYGLLAKPWNY